MYVLYKTDKTSGKRVEILQTKFFIQAENKITKELEGEYDATEIKSGWKNTHPVKRLGMTWENDKVRYDIVE